mmetsp:Transcript_35980/g.70795  ORF Transcript_35980/g.70795 Transcript_35980/m.70795 type:complete len:238 (+) Transcript_35980:440-1153(+)
MHTAPPPASRSVMHLLAFIPSTNRHTHTPTRAHRSSLTPTNQPPITAPLPLGPFNLPGPIHASSPSIRPGRCTSSLTHSLLGNVFNSLQGDVGERCPLYTSLLEGVCQSAEELQVFLLDRNLESPSLDPNEAIHQPLHLTVDFTQNLVRLSTLKRPRQKLHAVRAGLLVEDVDPVLDDGVDHGGGQFGLAEVPHGGTAQIDEPGEEYPIATVQGTSACEERVPRGNVLDDVFGEVTV